MPTSEPPKRREEAEATRVFREAFGTAPPAPEELASLLGDGLDGERYLRTILHFDAAVVSPLTRRGLRPRDSIVDLASGDGQLSVALALRGHRDLTLWDLDPERLERAGRLVHAFVRHVKGEDFHARQVHRTATEFEGPFDVLVCSQTIEHLSDRGNYSVASRSCQREFLRRVDAGVRRLAYFNAPNRFYPWDGHDTGKLFFHFLPIGLRQALIRRGLVRCSWDGVAEPVSVPFLMRRLPSFRLVSNYHAFDGAEDYFRNRPRFDYMGEPCPPLDPRRLPPRKRLIVAASRVLGRHAQSLLPVLSLVLEKREPPVAPAAASDGAS